MHMIETGGKVLFEMVYYGLVGWADAMVGF